MPQPSHIIGLHFPMFLERGYRYMDGAIRYAGEHPEVALRDFSYLHSALTPHRPPPWRGAVDGVVISGGPAPGFLEWLDQGGVPAVNTGADLSATSIPAAFSDPHSIARLEVEHLAGLGFKRFLHVGYRAVAGSRLRTSALKKELSQRGLRLRTFEVEELLRLKADGGIMMTDRIKSALRKELQAHERPLAILALDDRWGVVICELVESLGWRIPKDAAVLVVGDSNRARTCSPPLSVVRAPYEQIAYEATRMVHQLIEGKRLAKRQLPVLATELVARESTVGIRPSAPADIDHALELIRRHACEGINVEDIVRQLGVPMRTLKLRFGQAVGHSMGDEVRSVRLARAKELLTTTSLSVTRIAGLVGYNDSAHFAHFFRQHTALSPSEFRRQRK